MGKLEEKQITVSFVHVFVYFLFHDDVVYYIDYLIKY